MKTRVYPKSRKILNLIGDIAIITIAYGLSAIAVVAPGALETHHLLYSGMLPIAILLTVADVSPSTASTPSGRSASARSSSASPSAFSSCSS